MNLRVDEWCALGHHVSPQQSGIFVARIGERTSGRGIVALNLIAPLTEGRLVIYAPVVYRSGQHSRHVGGSGYRCIYNIWDKCLCFPVKLHDAIGHAHYGGYSILIEQDLGPRLSDTPGWRSPTQQV